jgi:hypothetical protein
LPDGNILLRFTSPTDIQFRFSLPGLKNDTTRRRYDLYGEDDNLAGDAGDATDFTRDFVDAFFGDAARQCDGRSGIYSGTDIANYGVRN